MSAHRTVVIIDVRPRAEYDAGHIANAHSFPLAEISMDCCALPSRDTVVEVVAGTDEDEATAKMFFARLKYDSLSVRKLHSSDIVDARAPPVEPCWSPDALLAESIAAVERECGGPGVAVDMGCGTGRDMVFLALRQWSVIGVDNRPRLLQQGQRLSMRHGVVGKTQYLQHTLRGQVVPVRRSSCDLLVVCRFLHRPGLRELFDIPRVGGFMLYSHFLEGCERSAVGHPSSSDGYLYRGELAKLCIELGYATILYSEDIALPDGRPFVRLLARRGAPSLGGKSPAANP